MRTASEKTARKRTAAPNGAAPAADVVTDPGEGLSDVTRLVEVLPSQIFVPPRLNIRQSFRKIDELARSLLKNGLLDPIDLRRGGPTSEQPYELEDGARRLRAWEKNGWLDKPILAFVRPPRERAVALDRLAESWAKNLDRDDFSALDQADCIHQLVTGSYAVTGDEPPAEPIDKKTICRRFGMSENYVGSLVHVIERLDSDVKLHARMAGAPMRLLIEISRVTGPNSDAVATGQSALLKEWIAKQEVLAEGDRKRAVRSDKKPRGGGGEAEESAAEARAPRVSVLKPGKRIDARGTVADYLSALEAKAAATKGSKERARFEAAVDLLRFLTGATPRFGLLTAKELAAVASREAVVTSETPTKKRRRG